MIAKTPIVRSLSLILASCLLSLPVTRGSTTRELQTDVFYRYIVAFQGAIGDGETDCVPPVATLAISAGSAALQVVETDAGVSCNGDLVCTGAGLVTFDVYQADGLFDQFSSLLLSVTLQSPQDAFTCSPTVSVAHGFAMYQACPDGTSSGALDTCFPLSAFQVTESGAPLCASSCTSATCTEQDLESVRTERVINGCAWNSDMSPAVAPQTGAPVVALTGAPVAAQTSMPIATQTSAPVAAQTFEPVVTTGAPVVAQTGAPVIMGPTTEAPASAPSTPVDLMMVTPDEFCSDFSELEQHFVERWNAYWAGIEVAPPTISGPHVCTCTEREPLTVECETEVLADDGATVDWFNSEKAVFQQQDGGRYVLETTKWCNTGPVDAVDPLQYCEETVMCDDGERICFCLATDCGCEVCPGGNFISVTCPGEEAPLCADEITGPFSNDFAFPTIVDKQPTLSPTTVSPTGTPTASPMTVIPMVETTTSPAIDVGSTSTPSAPTSAADPKRFSAFVVLMLSCVALFFGVPYS